MLRYLRSSCAPFGAHLFRSNAHISKARTAGMSQGVLLRSDRRGALSDSHCVLLLGWGGATDNMLAKYSKLYQLRGLDSLSFIAPFKMLGPSIEKMRDVSGLTSQLEDFLQSSSRRLIIHVMSMNGIWALVALLHQGRFQNLLQHTDAIVWDSCPADMQAWDGMLAYAKVLNQVKSSQQEESVSLWQSMNRIYSKAINLTQLVLFFGLGWLKVKVGASYSTVNAWYYLNEHPDLADIPHLFIYSDADQQCPAPSITAFHESLSKRSSNVRVLHLLESPHVQHLRVYPDQYNSAIDALLRNIETGESSKL